MTHGEYITKNILDFYNKRENKKPTRSTRASYFRECYKCYNESDMTVREFKTMLYEEREQWDRLGITEQVVDRFWESFVNGTYIY